MLKKERLIYYFHKLYDLFSNYRSDFTFTDDKFQDCLNLFMANFQKKSTAPPIRLHLQQKDTLQ